jgi:hypothetical protein
MGVDMHGNPVPDADPSGIAELEALLLKQHLAQMSAAIPGFGTAAVDIMGRPVDVPEAQALAARTQPFMAPPPEPQVATGPESSPPPLPKAPQLDLSRREAIVQIAKNLTNSKDRRMTEAVVGLREEIAETRKSWDLLAQHVAALVEHRISTAPADIEAIKDEVKRLGDEFKAHIERVGAALKT